MTETCRGRWHQLGRTKPLGPAEQSAGPTGQEAGGQVRAHSLVVGPPNYQAVSGRLIDLSD
jgi:hypothetical protein